MKQYKNTHYYITDDGKIWSDKTKRFLKPYLHPRGYYRVDLSAYGNKFIHRLVAETYIENPLNKKTVNHKNLDKTDNRVENLEWNTNSENMKHAWDNGGRSRKYKKVL